MDAAGGISVDVPLMGDARGAVAAAADMCRAGASGVFTFEGPNDPFLPLARVAGEVDVDLFTNIAVAFPRSPTHLAYTAWDLQRLSRGRFRLGLGTQIRPHVERRFGAAFDRPVDRMAAMVDAIRSAFACWQGGAPFRVDNGIWKLDLMPPLFNPGPLDWGAPPVLVAAMGPLMVRGVTAWADGILLHPFTSSRHLHEVMIPRVVSGLAEARRDIDGFSVEGGAIVAVGEDDASVAESSEAARGLLGFYGSTPAYREVLEAEGVGDLRPRLRDLTRSQAWSELAGVIPDELLDRFVIRGTPAEVGAELRRRFGGVADRVAVTCPGGLTPELLSGIVDAAAG